MFTPFYFKKKLHFSTVIIFASLIGAWNAYGMQGKDSIKDNTDQIQKASPLITKISDNRDAAREMEHIYALLNLANPDYSKKAPSHRKIEDLLPEIFVDYGCLGPKDLGKIRLLSKTYKEATDRLLARVKFIYWNDLSKRSKDLCETYFTTNEPICPFFIPLLYDLNLTNDLLDAAGVRLLAEKLRNLTEEHSAGIKIYDIYLKTDERGEAEVRKSEMEFMDIGVRAAHLLKDDRSYDTVIYFGSEGDI